MANVLYTRGIPEWSLWTTNVYKVLLVDSGYTPNVDHDYVSDITAGAELVATDYVRKTLAGCSATIDDTLNRVTYDATDVTWTALGGAVNETGVAAVIYRFVSTDANSPLMAYLDTADFTTNDSDLVLVFNTSGICYADQGA